MKILFVVTEDWFFKSHFEALADRARRDGHQVLIAARDSGAMAGEDVRIIDMPFARRALGPLAVRGQIQRLQQIIDRERPDVIHAIALKPIALTILAHARGAGRALALTGRGYLALKGVPPWTALIGVWFRHLLRGALDQPRTVLLVENLRDKTWVEGGRPLSDQGAVLMPGAGVNIDDFTVVTEPSGMPIVVGIVARLIRSKGIDLAVDAVAKLRGRGLEIVLRIAGDADRQNPEHVSTAEVDRWRVTPGVELVGRIFDVATFWASVHIACLPSRGGEGLPRSLLEAAACGRPIVTTDVPGCVDFVGDDAGIVTPREDATALASALELLARDAELRRKLGASGRAKVERAYTTGHAAEQAARAWALVSDGT
jgi:glycosyltransferase involved in cell wall biosynthesis